MDLWKCEWFWGLVVGMGGLEREMEMEKPFHTERAQSARVAFMAAAPVDDSWAENEWRKNCQ